jgi:predicted MFS family arabinose efflux permease
MSSPTRAVILTAVIAGCTIAMLGFGIRAGFGLFLAPMSADLGWGREIFALAIAIQNLFWGAGQPIAGAIADKFGAGRVLALGGLMYAFGVYVMSQASSPLELHISAGVIVGLGIAFSSFSLALAAIARMVDERHRSMVMGLVTAAGSLGQFVMVPIGQAFLDTYGWSFALVLLSMLSLIIVPLAWPVRSRPGGAASTQPQTIGQALHEASRHRGFVLLTAGFFVCGFHVAFIQVHLPAYVSDMGLPGEIGAWALALVGLFNVVGSLASGYFGGRYSKKNMLSLIYFARAAVIAGFILTPVSATSVMVFAGAMGLLWLSTVPPTSAIVAQVFGPQYMAMLFGIVFFSHQIGAFTGVWLGGYLFDTTGSYDVVWWGGVVLGIFAGIVHLPINERPLARLAQPA